MFFQRQSGPCAATGGARGSRRGVAVHRDVGIQSDRRGSRDSRARPSNAADHRRGSDADPNGEDLHRPDEAGRPDPVSGHRRAGQRDERGVACPTGSGGSGQNAALTAERVSASLWRLSPLAVSDEAAMRAIWFVLATLLLLPPPASEAERHLI